MPTNQNLMVKLLKLALCKSDNDACTMLFEPASEASREQVVLAWNEIWNEAIFQGVEGLIFRALPLINPSSRPSSEWLMQMAAHMATLEKESLLYNNSVWPILNQLQATGLPLVLLKGQTLASLWPVPEHRPIGDVDLYVSPSNQTAILLKLKQLNANIDHLFDKKHVAFRLNGLNWELHYKTTYFFWSSTEKYYQQLEKQYSQATELYSQQIGPNSVAVFHPLFNTLYLTAHIQHHLILEEVCFKQLIDWMLFIQAERAALAVAETALIEHLKQLNLWRLYCALGYICITYLGMPANQYAGLSNLSRKNSRHGEFLYNIIKQRHIPGCRPYESRNPNETWLKKAYLFGELVKRCILLFGIAPKECIAAPFGIIGNAFKRRTSNPQN